MAAIHAVTDTAISLVGGHDGIYEIAVGSNVLYTNQGDCAAALPSDTELVAQIAPLAGFDADPADGPVQMIEPGDGATCPILNAPTGLDRVASQSIVPAMPAPRRRAWLGR